MSSVELLKPVVDVIFKKIFGQDKKTCLAFICAVLGWDPEDVKELDFEFGDKDLIPAYPDSKEGILDVLVKLGNGNIINIEIQITHQPYYAKRCLFYWAHKYHTQLEAGGRYADLNKVIGIHILTENYFHQYTEMHNEFAICHTQTKERVEQMGDLELHFIELAKFNNQWEQDALSHWCLFLKEPMMITDKLDADTSIKRAYEELEKLSLDKKLRGVYEARLKALRDFESAVDGGFEKGKAEGRAEGRAEGKAEGRAEGKAEGKAEGLKEASRLLIHTMHQNGCSIEQIAQMTSLSVGDIQKLLQ